MQKKHPAPKGRGGRPGWQRMLHDWRLYLMLLPALVWLVIFCYVPMYGVLIAFKDFRDTARMYASPCAGLQYFQQY